MQVVKISLIGCGAVTLKAHIPALMNDPREKISGYKYQIVAAASLDDENLEYIKSVLPSVDVFSDYHQLLQDSDCNAVLIATGEDMHPLICKDALDAGKYVLCEKPLGSSAYQIEQFLSENDHNVAQRLQIAFNKRFYPAYNELIEHRRNAEFGIPICGSYSFFTQQGKKSGWVGILSNLIHYCDLITAIHGIIVDVKCIHRSDDNGITLAVTMLSEDSSVVSLLFTSAASWHAGFHEEWQLVDQNRNRFIASNSDTWFLYQHTGVSKTNSHSNSVFWLPDTNGYKTQLKSFYDLVTGVREYPEIGIHDALKAHRLFEMISIACEQNEDISSAHSERRKG